MLNGSKQNAIMITVILSLIVLGLALWALPQLAIGTPTAHYYGQVLSYTDLTQQTAAQGKTIHCIPRREPNLFMNLSVMACYDTVAEADEALAEQQAAAAP